MATTEQKRARAITEVLKDNAAEPPAVKEAAINAVVGGPSQGATDEIWKLLIFGLLLLLVVALGGMLVIIVGSGAPHDAALTVFTTTLAGLIGLFAPSPTRGGSGNGNTSGTTPPAGGQTNTPAGGG